MQPQFLPHVATLLYDPIHSNRHLTRNALFTLGFREVDVPVTVPELRRALELGDFDLAILDVTENEAEICALVHDLRHGRLGRNPFMVVVMTTWNQRGDLVRRVIDCGADDLLVRPLSTGQLKNRIAQQVDARKNFVVTSNYIGPDRRRDQNRKSDEDMLIAVPNSLQSKARDGVLSGPSATEINAVRANIDRKRIEQAAFHIAITCRLIQEHVANPTPGIDPQNEIAQLMQTVTDLCTRLVAPGFELVEMFAEGLTKAGDQLRGAMAGGDPAATQQPLALLAELAAGIRVALDPLKNEQSFAAEIGETVARIQARRATQGAPAAEENRRSSGA